MAAHPETTQRAVPDFQSHLQQAVDREFLIERELSGAGMSRVFVATERALQRRVVVKVLPPELAAGVNIERFRREIQLAAGLQHPHIVPLLAAGDNDGLLWFSMPYIEGESLRNALREKGRLGARDVVRILHDVVDALAYAHARGVVHRDIKPDNILTSGMHALVTDFGVAKALSAAIPTHGGTTTGMAIGTPAYMAPEQLAADPAADHRVDIYAVGLLAYELLTGHSPFTSSSPQATLAAQLTKVPEPPHRSFSDIPESLSAIIMSCLEKDAAKRPQTADALLAELDALPPMGTGSVLPRVRRRSRVPVIVGSVAALLALSVVFAQRFRTEQPAGKRDTGTAMPDTVRARDAGAGGSRTPVMDLVTGETRLRARPETVIVIYRDTSRDDGARSAARDDGAPGISVPVVISRAESLSIAEAVRKRQSSSAPTAAGLANQQGTASNAAAEPASFANGAKAARMFSSEGTQAAVAIERDELLREVRRVFSDSMSKALHSMDSALALIPRYGRMEGTRSAPPLSVMPLVSPNADGRTRVVIAAFTNGTGKPEMGNVGRDLSNYLRTSLPSDRYDVVDFPTTERVARHAPDRMAIGWMLRADFVVSGVVRERGDSLSLVTIFTDVRGGQYSRAGENLAPGGDVKQGFDASLARVNGWLDSARTRTLRRPPRTPPRTGDPG